MLHCLLLIKLQTELVLHLVRCIINKVLYGVMVLHLLNCLVRFQSNVRDSSIQHERKEVQNEVSGPAGCSK